MTFSSIYVGTLDNFDWSGNWNGNIPVPISKPFPSWRGTDVMPFHYWVKKTAVFCKQTDFDGHVARVSKSQIFDFIEFCYGTDERYIIPKDNVTSKHDANLIASLEEIKTFVASLDEDVSYGLVGECF